MKVCKHCGMENNGVCVNHHPVEQELTALENALKLAFIKLQQVGGFNTVDGVQTPDRTAYQQILDAIHSFDPNFGFGDEPKHNFGPPSHVPTDDFVAKAREVSGEITPAQEQAIDDWFWNVLPKDREHVDRRQTGLGTKTKLGLLRTMERIVKTR